MKLEEKLLRTEQTGRNDQTRINFNKSTIYYFWSWMFHFRDIDTHAHWHVSVPSLLALSGKKQTPQMELWKFSPKLSEPNKCFVASFIATQTIIGNSYSIVLAKFSSLACERTFLFSVDLNAIVTEAISLSGYIKVAIVILCILLVGKIINTGFYIYFADSSHNPTICIWSPLSFIQSEGMDPRFTTSTTGIFQTLIFLFYFATFKNFNQKLY